MALVRTPRSTWIEAGLRALASGGPDAVRIEPLARALDVSKGGFSRPFADRGTLLGELLHTWERVSIDEVIERIEAPGGARTGLRRRFALASANDELLRIDLAVPEWARRDATIADRLRRVDNRRMQYMRSRFAGSRREPAGVPSGAPTGMTLTMATVSGWAPTGAPGDEEGRVRDPDA